MDVVGGRRRPVAGRGRCGRRIDGLYTIAVVFIEHALEGVEQVGGQALRRRVAEIRPGGDVLVAGGTVPATGHRRRPSHLCRRPRRRAGILVGVVGETPEDAQGHGFSRHVVAADLDGIRHPGSLVVRHRRIAGVEGRRAVVAGGAAVQDRPGHPVMDLAVAVAVLVAHRPVKTGQRSAADLGRQRAFVAAANHRGGPINVVIGIAQGQLGVACRQQLIAGFHLGILLGPVLRERRIEIGGGDRAIRMAVAPDPVVVGLVVAAVDIIGRPQVQILDGVRGNLEITAIGGRLAVQPGRVHGESGIGGRVVHLRRRGGRERRQSVVLQFQTDPDIAGEPGVAPQIIAARAQEGVGAGVGRQRIGRSQLIRRRSGRVEIGGVP